VRIPSGDGTLLEARWDLPAGPVGPAVVLCHPHPLHGGTMNVPLLRTVAARLVRRGFPVLRFNFRGVGASGGSWSGGDAEEGDVAAAAAAALAAFPPGPPSLAGWSFGAVAALRWQAALDGAFPLVAIAPPLSAGLSPGLPPPEALPPAPRLFIIGDRDQFTAAADLRTYAEACGAGLLVLPGSDHFFFGRESRVADAVAGHLASTSA